MSSLFVEIIDKRKLKNTRRVVIYQRKDLFAFLISTLKGRSGLHFSCVHWKRVSQPVFTRHVRYMKMDFNSTSRSNVLVRDRYFGIHSNQDFCWFHLVMRMTAITQH